MKLPVVNKGITFSEIPNKVSVFLEMGGCRQKCKGCHSAEWLCTHINQDFWTDLEDLKAYVTKEKNNGAQAVVIMGGTNNTGVTLPMIIETIKELSKILPVGLYSGLPVNARAHKILAKVLELKYLKVGNYIEQRGPLDNPKTNQKFFARGVLLPNWHDMTYIFQIKERRSDSHD